MRVCLVTGEYPPMRGGVGDYTAFLAAALTRRGVDVSVLTTMRAINQPSSTDRSKSKTPPTGRVAVRPDVESWGWKGAREIIAHVDGTRPDIVHLQFQTGAFGMQLGVHLVPWMLRLSRHRARFVVTFHDLKAPYLFPKASVLRHFALPFMTATADGVVATNAEDLRILAQRGGRRTRLPWGARPLAAIPIGSNIPNKRPSDLDRAALRRRLDIADDQLLLSYFGFLNPSKGVDVLVDAFARLLAAKANVRLLMIGGAAGDSNPHDRPFERQIRQSLDRPDLRAAVRWTGFTEADLVSAHLQATDISVLPFREGVSLRHGTLIAAIVHGLPIVTTHSRLTESASSLPALISGTNVLTAAPGDPIALAQAIDQLVRDPDLRATIGRGALTLASHFDWDTIAMQTLRLYQSLGSTG